MQVYEGTVKLNGSGHLQRIQVTAPSYAAAMAMLRAYGTCHGCGPVSG